MGKFLGMVATAATLVFALACGGSSSSSTSTGSYKGAIDGSVIASTDNIVVAAYDANGLLKATADSTSGLTAGATAGEDHFFTLTGLTEGSTYRLKAYRLGTPVGGLQSVDSVDNKVEVLSTIATVDSTSGTSATVLSKATVTTRQMNAFTTYIAQKVSSVSASALSATLLVAFGGNTVDLASIRNTGGALVVGTNSLSALGANAAVTEAVSYIATAAYTAASVPSSQISAVSASLQAAITSLASATSTELANLGASIFAAINTAITDPTFLAAFNQNLAFVAPTVKTLVDFAGGFSTLTTASGVTGTSGNVATAVTNSTKVTSFELVDSTYGSRSGTTFTVGTLAPVFKVTFDKVVTSPSSLVTLTLKNKVSGQTYSTLASASSQVDQILSTSSNTLYLYVKKSASTTLAAGELEPGSSYDFSLAAVSNLVSFDGSFKYNGSVRTRTVTITYPYIGNNTSVVKIDGAGGVGASAVYYLHSSVDLNVNSAKTDYGFFGGTSYLNAGIVSSPTATISASPLAVTGVVAGSTTGTAKAGVVTVSGLSTTSNTTYTVTLTKDQGLFSGSTEVTDYPTTLKMTTF